MDKGYILMDDVLVVLENLKEDSLDNLSKETLAKIKIIVCNGTMIEAEALYFCCNTREIYLSEAITEIHQTAFTHCEKLEKIVISRKTLNAVIRAAFDEDFFEEDERMESVFDENELVEKLTEYLYIRFDVKVIVY